MAKTRAQRRAVLVYQAGIANVFEVQSFNMADYGREAKLLMQADFRSCENFTRGLAIAGWLIVSASCNLAGNIQWQKWTADIDDAPFRESMHPVYNGARA